MRVHLCVCMHSEHLDQPWGDHSTWSGRRANCTWSVGTVGDPGQPVWNRHYFSLSFGNMYGHLRWRGAGPRAVITKINEYFLSGVRRCQPSGRHEDEHSTRAQRVLQLGRGGKDLACKPRCSACGKGLHQSPESRAPFPGGGSNRGGVGDAEAASAPHLLLSLGIIWVKFLHLTLFGPSALLINPEQSVIHFCSGPVLLTVPRLVLVRVTSQVVASVETRALVWLGSE